MHVSYVLLAFSIEKRTGIVHLVEVAVSVLLVDLKLHLSDFLHKSDSLADLAVEIRRQLLVCEVDNQISVRHVHTATALGVRQLCFSALYRSVTLFAVIAVEGGVLGADALVDTHAIVVAIAGDETFGASSLGDALVLIPGILAVVIALTLLHAILLENFAAVAFHLLRRVRATIGWSNAFEPVEEFIAVIAVAVRVLDSPFLASAHARDACEAIVDGTLFALAHVVFYLSIEAKQTRRWLWLLVCSARLRIPVVPHGVIALTRVIRDCTGTCPALEDFEESLFAAWA